MYTIGAVYAVTRGKDKVREAIKKKSRLPNANSNGKVHSPQFSTVGNTEYKVDSMLTGGQQLVTPFVI